MPRPKEKTGEPYLLVRLELPQSTHDRLRALADAAAKPMSVYVRELVTRHVRKSRK